MKRYFEMVNEENRIASASILDFPEELLSKESGFDSEKIPFYYDVEQDVIVFFKERDGYMEGIKIAEKYLGLSEECKVLVALECHQLLFEMFVRLGQISGYRASQEGSQAVEKES